MPDILLNVQRADYVSDRQAPVSAWRAYAEAQFVTPSGALTPFSCVVDTGAPISVLPYSLWHDRNLQWTSLGTRLARHGRPAPYILEWQGIPCELGETTAYIADAHNGVQAGPFLIVAKFVRQRNPKRSVEAIAVLGMNFLTDNLLRLVLDGTGTTLLVRLTVP